MKNYFLAIIASTLLLSCAKKEEKKNTPSENEIKKEVKKEEKEKLTFTKEQLVGFWQGMNIMDGGDYKLMEDGTYTYAEEQGILEEGKWEIKEGNLLYLGERKFGEITKATENIIYFTTEVRLRKIK